MEVLCLGPKGFDEDQIFREIPTAQIDKQKLTDFANRLREVEAPQVESPEAKNAMTDAMNHVARAVYTIEVFCE